MDEQQGGETAPDAGTSESQAESQAETKTETVDWKAKSREWEKRAKENKAAADELAKLKESQKTEAQRQQEALEEALGRASRTEIDLWKERAARKYGLDDELMAFLAGETEEELGERAKTLADKLGKQGEAKRPPAPDKSQGRGSGGSSTGGSVSAGRELYAQRRGKAKT